MPRLVPRSLRTAGLLLLLSLVAGLIPAGFTAAQGTALPDMRWVSPTWGYTIRWFSNEWTVADERFSDRTDVLVLTDTLGNVVTFQGTPDFGGDAEACLDWLLADTEEMPEIAGFDLAQDAGGSPYVFRSPTQSYAVFLMSGTGADDVPREFAAYAECQTLVPGVAVLQRTYAGPPDVFEEWYDDLVKTIEGVFLPASAWIAEDPLDPAYVWAGLAPLAGKERIDASFMLDDADRPHLLVGLEAESGPSRMVAFENVGEGPVSVDPSAVALTLVSITGEIPDQTWPLTSIRWEGGFVGDANGARELAPGERATAVLDFTSGDLSGITCDVLPFLLLTYQPPTGASIEFAASDLPPELSDCLPFPDGPAMGRPVLAPASLPQPPSGSAITREPVLEALDGRLDDLGRIPMARLTVAPGTTFDELPNGPMALIAESGSATAQLDNIDITLPVGEPLTADDGAGLVVRNDASEEATLLVLSLAPPGGWDTLPEDDPFRDSSESAFTPLFAELSLLHSRAARQFTIERVRLEPGSSFVPIAAGSASPERAAVLVESGSVMVQREEGAGQPDEIFSGETAAVPPDGAVAATADGPASVLVVSVS